MKKGTLMATTTKPTPVSARFSPFSGIDTRHTHSGEPATAELVNFRILPDGSLQKREGILPCHELPGTCRASWTGMLLGNERTYLLCGDTVCTIVPEMQSLISLGTVSSSEGAADFFYYRDCLYLCDGIGLYEIANKPPTPAKPYIPLIGRDWPSAILGERCEPRNYATRRARISYLIEPGFMPYLRTGAPVASIEGIFRNDIPMSDEDYYFDIATECLVVSGMEAGDRILALITYAEETESEEARIFSSCTRADTYGGIHNSRVLMWNGSRRNILFPSRDVSAEALAESRVHCPDSGSLYFPEHTEVILGDGRYPITGICRHYDRLLLFTSDSAFKADFDPSEPGTLEMTEINPYFGCASRDAVSHCENDPITVGRHAILRWNEGTDEHDECNAENICAPIQSLLSDSFFRTAIVHYARRRRELWFHAKGGGDTVWIYGIDTGAWYRFSGIRADCFLELNHNVAFCYGQTLWIMDETAFADFDSTWKETSIRAVFQSGLLEYGSERQKHAAGISLRADSEGTLDVTLTPDVGSPVTVRFAESAQSNHRLHSRRLSSGRFRHATLRLVSDDMTRPTVHSLVSLVR